MPRHRLLLVDDDRAIRTALSARLVNAGHAVREADSGRAALSLIEAGFSPDLVCTDVEMPGGLDGLALAAEITRTCPGTKVVVMSGRDDVTPPEGGVFVGKAGGLSKVVAAIERLLEPAAPALLRARG